MGLLHAQMVEERFFEEWLKLIRSKPNCNTLYFQLLHLQLQKIKKGLVIDLYLAQMAEEGLVKVRPQHAQMTRRPNNLKLREL